MYLLDRVLGPGVKTICVIGVGATKMTSQTYRNPGDRESGAIGGKDWLSTRCGVRSMRTMSGTHNFGQ